MRGLCLAPLTDMTGHSIPAFGSIVHTKCLKTIPDCQDRVFASSYLDICIGPRHDVCIVLAVCIIHSNTHTTSGPAVCIVRACMYSSEKYTQL